MSADLHCHTKLSDGSLGIDDIITLAKKQGVDTLAITDHDCLAGTIRAKIIGERQGINVIPAVEISSTDDEGNEVNILCYFSESPDRLEGLCHRNLVARKRAAQLMMIKASQRFPVTPDLILKCAQGSTDVYKTHIMSALVESGVSSNIYGELYNALFSEEHPSNILAKAKFESTASVIETIHDAGGIAVLAHAGTYKNGDSFIDTMIEADIDGIEVWTPHHNKETTNRLLKYAEDKSILALGGSDFHGRYNRFCVSIGDYSTPDEQYKELVKYKAKLRRKAKQKAAATASVAE